MKDRIEKTLTKSRDNRWAIRLKSNSPKNSNFDGIVLHYNSDVIVIHEISDFLFVGITVINRKKIRGVRDNEYEECENAIIRDNKSLNELTKLKWIRTITNLNELIRIINKKKIWPGIGMVDKKSLGFYLGPITDVSKTDFSLYCYDAKGKWEKEYKLKYNGIRQVEISSKYSDVFNGFMKRNNPFPSSINLIE